MTVTICVLKYRFHSSVLQNGGNVMFCHWITSCGVLVKEHITTSLITEHID